MRVKEYQKMVEHVSNYMEEGIHVVSCDGISVLYSETMAEIEKVKTEDVLGKQFRESFAHIPEGESTLLRALEKGQTTLNKQQTFLNAYGKEVTTVNTTLPIEMNGKVIAAVEIAKDITNIKEMSDTLMKWQEEHIDPPKKAQPKIRHYNFYDITGENKDFQKVIGIAKKAAQSDNSVFIYGETGTGKELFAQSMHYDGKRKKGPFLGQNCAALPESLLEGILFGTTKGGFTGAVDRAGLFEQADGGTLLLDEISAMPYDLQSKLLRVLQEDYIRRVGGTKDIPVDVRIIATVNETPEKLIESGALRKDLFYRLAIINLSIPPLRNRKNDIPPLVGKFMEKQCRRQGKIVRGIDEDALKKLFDHDFPGNVRELENIITSAVGMVDEGGSLKEDHILIHAHSEGKKIKRSGYEEGKEALDEYLFMVEREILQKTMATYEGNISKGAKALGIKRQTLQHKLKKFNL